MYVFFPRYLSGQSPKLTNRWKGPFKVLEKCTDVTYKVDCGGPRRKPQVIHVDRRGLSRLKDWNMKLRIQTGKAMSQTMSQ